MGNVTFDEQLRTAERFARASRQQEAGSSEEADARMLDRRRRFMLASDRVFFESIIEGSDMMPLRYLALGQLAARAVGRLHLNPGEGQGDGFATGFLVAPNLLLTNKHVLRSTDWARAATLTLDAEDDIHGLPLTPRVFLLDPARVYASDDELDFCFVAVQPRAVDGTPLSAYGHLRLFPDTGKIVREEYATIIQHPNGRQKHIAARNNQIRVYVYDDDLSAEERAKNHFMYYSTDTLRGSSGSPVLSDQWFVVALHRRGVPKTTALDGTQVVVRTNGQPAAADDPEEVIAYVSNEGVRISRILERLGAIAASADHAEREGAARAQALLEGTNGSVSLGPLSSPTATYAALQDTPRAAALRIRTGESFEVTRRAIGLFPENLGYQEKFLRGHTIPLPEPKAALRRELAPRLDKPDEFHLPFRHFTTMMHAERRLPVFAAVNISGTLRPKGGMGQRPPWSYDPRIDESHQPDDSIFSSMLQRGHMAAREYVFWGRDADEMRQADTHSFTLTNVCPQIQAFNGHVEWYEIERQVVAGAKDEERRITEFVGPIFGSRDPAYDDLRSRRSKAERGTGIRIPLRFWKIVAWVEDGALQHRALILDQSDELDAAGPLEFDIELPEGVRESTVAEIERLTDLKFAGLR